MTTTLVPCSIGRATPQTHLNRVRDECSEECARGLSCCDYDYLVRYREHILWLQADFAITIRERMSEQVESGMQVKNGCPINGIWEATAKRRDDGAEKLVQ